MTTDPAQVKTPKVANLLFQLRVGSDANLFGRMAYGLFWIWGVEGLPPIPNPPKTLSQISRIPRGYGLEFGKKVFGMAAAKFSGNRDKAEELLSEFLTVKIMDKQHKLADKFKGLPLSEAEAIVMASVRNFALQTKRDDAKEKHIEGPGKTDLSEMQNLINSPDQGGAAEELVDEGSLSTVIREVQKLIEPKRPDIARDIPLYFEHLLDGLSDAKIINNKMLPFLEEDPMSQAAWSKTYRGVIKNVMNKHLERHASIETTLSVVEQLLQKTAGLPVEAKTMPQSAHFTRLVVIHAKEMFEAMSGEADLQDFYTAMADLMEACRLSLIKAGDKEMDTLLRRVVSELHGKSAVHEYSDVSLDSLMNEKVAKEFPNSEALKTYLRDHPDADPKKHKVKKEDGSSGSGSQETVEVKDKSIAKDLGDLGLPSTGAVNSVKKMIEDGRPVPHSIIHKAIVVLNSQANNPGMDKDKSKKLREVREKLKGLGRGKEASSEAVQNYRR